jgi:hypothetical protein
MQSRHYTQFPPCRYSNQQPPTCSPVTLHTLLTATIQISILHYSVQFFYSHYPPTLLKPPSPKMNLVTLLIKPTAALQTTNPSIQSSHSNHINHSGYSNHHSPSCIQLLFLHYLLPLFKTTNPHH